MIGHFGEKVVSTAIKVFAVAGTLAGAVVFDALVLRADDGGSAYVGFGSQTDGGAGGEVVKVTSLAEDGVGTLRWAVETATGPRIVEFDVSGTIALTDQIEIGNDISILGETSPEGVTITGARLRVYGSDVILSGLRIRPGDGPGAALESRDGISVGKEGHAVRNVVIDGNSITWAVDENLTLWGDVQNVTISNNIIADALDEAGHPKGDHGMGLLIGGGDVARVTVVGNLFANNPNRNPTVKDSSREIEVVNNLIYNWSENGMNGTDSTVHILGNVYNAGVDTEVPEAIVLKSNVEGALLYYLDDNQATARVSQGIADQPVFDPSGVPVMPSAAVTEHVLATAGARLPALDHVDTRVIQTAVEGTGRIINAVPDFADTKTAQSTN